MTRYLLEEGVPYSADSPVHPGSSHIRALKQFLASTLMKRPESSGSIPGAVSACAPRGQQCLFALKEPALLACQGANKLCLRLQKYQQEWQLAKKPAWATGSRMRENDAFLRMHDGSRLHNKNYHQNGPCWSLDSNCPSLSYYKSSSEPRGLRGNLKNKYLI